jgi:predicted O-linked N-acetylglucosamine transferase (SPINDLY family)
LDEHLKRIQLANLFLDTYPYGAHTSASDALRVALPVVTLQGKSFASRVCSSLLLNLNLPELVANNIDEYIAIACRLANHQKDYEALRVKLKESIKNSPVFDAARFTLDFEKNLLDIYHKKSVA